MPRGTPRKLLLLSPDPKEGSLLCQHLDRKDRDQYVFQCFASIEELKSTHFDSNYYAILLDIRNGHAEAMQSIRRIGDLQTSAPLICLCRSHEQLRHYHSVIHLIDDYILADTLPDGELSARMSHAIRKRHKEQELLHEQNLLQSLLDNIPDAIYFKDRDSRFTKVNKAMARRFDQEPGNIVGKSDFDLFTEEHARQAYEDEQRIIETGKAIVSKIEKETYESRAVKWVNTSKVPLRDRYGKIIGTMGISRDVSDLKRAQDNLTEEHRLLSTILNNVPDRIFVKNCEGRYIASNHLHMRFLGADDEDEVIGTTLYDHTPLEHADKYAKEDLEIIRSGRGLINSEEARKNADGSTTWYLTSKVPLIDETGKSVGIVGISRDVTAQKENEEKLRNTIAVLKETQLQLIEAEKLKTVGRLAAGVAHEVKNPLNVISLGAEYLHEQVKEPDELVEIILFDPFYSTKSTGEGTGLGLTVTRSIIEMHRGIITLKSREDSPGARAIIHLPVTQDSHA